MMLVRHLSVADLDTRQLVINKLDEIVELNTWNHQINTCIQSALNRGIMPDVVTLLHALGTVEQISNNMIDTEAPNPIHWNTLMKVSWGLLTQRELDRTDVNALELARRCIVLLDDIVAHITDMQVTRIVVFRDFAECRYTLMNIRDRFHRSNVIVDTANQILEEILEFMRDFPFPM